MSHLSKKYYLWWREQFISLDSWSDVICCEGAYVASIGAQATFYGVIRGHQWISINRADVPKEMLAGMTLMEVQT